MRADDLSFANKRAPNAGTISRLANDLHEGVYSSRATNSCSLHGSRDLIPPTILFRLHVLAVFACSCRVRILHILMGGALVSAAIAWGQPKSSSPCREAAPE